MSEEEDGTRGAPANNSNAVSHGLYQDREKLFKRLSDEEKRIVVDISTDLLDKFNGDVGAYERNAIRNIALDSLKRMQANEEIITEEIVCEGSERSEAINKAYDRIVRTMTQELEKLGLLDEGPEMKKAEAQEGWMSEIENAQEDVIDVDAE